MIAALHQTQIYRTKEEYVYDVLHTAILNCELKPGEKLVLDRLKDELGISPIPIRSALTRLEVEGLVEITPHTGAVVSPVSLNEIAEIFSLLETLERMAYGVAAERATDEDIEQLEEIVTRMDGAAQIQNKRLWSDLNTEFHYIVAQVTGMKLLIEFTQRTMEKWIRLSRCYFAQIGSLRMEQAQAEHRQILELLAARDSVALEEMAIQHNRLAYLAYQELIATENMKSR